MNKEERMLKIQNDLNFGIETKDGTFYVPKDDVIKIVSDLIDEVSQPQLTISKSVADEIDLVEHPIGQIALKNGSLSDFSVESKSWIYESNEHGYIAAAYANPLTKHLVKVVEG